MRPNTGLVGFNTGSVTPSTFLAALNAPLASSNTSPVGLNSALANTHAILVGLNTAPVSPNTALGVIMQPLWGIMKTGAKQAQTQEVPRAYHDQGDVLSNFPALCPQELLRVTVENLYRKLLFLVVIGPSFA